MKENKYEKKVFDEYACKITEINEHYDGCHYASSTAPIDVCACQCYNKQVFRMGRKAEKDLFYGGNVLQLEVQSKNTNEKGFTLIELMIIIAIISILIALFVPLFTGIGLETTGGKEQTCEGKHVYGNGNCD